MTDQTEGTDILSGVALLRELALDLRWSWNHATDALWSRLDPELWTRTRNPWLILRTVSRERLRQTLIEPEFRSNLDRLATVARDATSATAHWFGRTYTRSALQRVAYFSLEFMLSEALPIYAGGLGNVAGDQLKAASDLGVPIIGVSLLYQRGYFRQMIARDGSQQALYPYNDPGQLPVTPLRLSNGEWLRLEIRLPGHALWLRAWQAQVGRLHLYLLDSNDGANYAINRGITSELYGGGPEMRLQQEIVLGIGGWRLLEALGLSPEVCHLNEGHAALAVLERARSFMRSTGVPFDAALCATRAGNVFTTHTAVPAGFDLFAPALIEEYLGRYAEHELRISVRELLALGRRVPVDDSEPLNMAYLALRGSGRCNGVSRLHGEVSRRIFQPLFPNWPLAEVPVGQITNGVHMPSWDSAEADELWTNLCGKDRWLGTLQSLGEIRSASDAALWQCRAAARARLVSYARAQLVAQLEAAGAAAADVEAARHVFRADVLTIGFARRFATYKRPNLLLRDPERLMRLLTDSQRPVQLILAGKAHPADEPGQALIREWVQFVRHSGARLHAIFLADDDMQMMEYLTQGVDVWINTPRRPWEACGTSGMKILVNGGLNLSELDGWWAEAYAPAVGWALGDGKEHDDDPAWDAAEAARLYEMLEREIVPEFYARDEQGLPHAWLARVRESMTRLTAVYSANRSVRQYLEECYLPAAAAYHARAANSGAAAVALTGRLRALTQAWPSLRFGDVRVDTRDRQHHFRASLVLGALAPEAIRVQLYAEAVPGASRVIEDMVRAPAESTAAMEVYVASASADRPSSDYTVRIIPALTDACIPLEARHILWQR
jgi:glycogen phosphorylase